MAPAGTPEAGSDDAFISFAFTIVSVICCIVYIPIGVRAFKAVKKLAAGGKKPESPTSPTKKGANPEEEVAPEDTFFEELRDHVTFIPNLIRFAIANPGKVSAGYQLLKKESETTKKIFLPKVLNWCFRPKYLLFFVWCVLFTMALYTNLSFDPHSVLGVANDATDAQIRKAYRKLTRMYHPDHNKTEAAVPIYAQVKRAYKALVDAEEFEKDAMQEGLSASVALPSFMFNKGFVVVMVLAFVVGLPLWGYRKFVGAKEKNQIGEWLEKLFDLEERMTPLVYEFGVPIEKKFLQRQTDLAKMQTVLRAVGIPVQNPRMLEMWPPMHEIAKRSREGTRHAAYFHQLGLNDHHQAALTEFLNQNPEAFRLESSAQDNKDVKVQAGDQYDATMFVLQQLMKESNDIIHEFNQFTKGNLKSLYMLRRQHDTLIELLGWAKDGRCASKDIMTLIECPRVSRQYVMDIIHNINALNQKAQKEQMKEHQKKMGVKHARR